MASDGYIVDFAMLTSRTQCIFHVNSNVIFFMNHLFLPFPGVPFKSEANAQHELRLLPFTCALYVLCHLCLIICVPAFSDCHQ